MTRTTIDQRALQGLSDAIAERARELATLRAENERLREWVNDLQSGMFINCVYCGHRYGPSDEVPASMAEVLRQHVEKCPEHPMSALRAENDRLRRRLELVKRTAEAWERAWHDDPGDTRIEATERCARELRAVLEGET